jgi:DNA polymerase I-like protein with 3'-5' exonuclease and polymerase domains
MSQFRPKLPKGTYIIIGVDSTGSCSVASNPKVHLSENTVFAEAERLASTTPNKQFVPVKVLGTAVIPTRTVLWA